MKTSLNDFNLRETQHRQKVDEIHRKHPELKEIEDELRILLSNLTAAMIGGSQSLQLDKLQADLVQLRQRRREFLANNSLPDDYNQLKNLCQLCQDTGFIKGPHGFTVCDCVKNISREKSYGLAKIPLKMRQQNFDNFSLHYYRQDEMVDQRDSEYDKAQKVLTGAKEFTQSIKDGQETKGLYIFGGAGVGKTHLVSAIANDLIEAGIVPLYLMVADLLDEIRRGFESDQGRENADLLIEQARGTRVLILDDIGAERSTDWSVEKLFQIVNERYLNQAPIVFTSNYDLYDLEDRMGAGPTGSRICSRIVEMCRLFSLEAKDIRFQKRKEGLA
ncbi:MAG: ATP-binding protein [Firmicutes bacterium]|jgi:DNA replication protein DnaC|nr:ATP-binding protein [Bacillota bacterium]